MLVCRTHNKIVDLVPVSFIHILLPQFLTDGLVNVLLFEVGNFCVYLGTHNARVGGDCWHLWVGEGCQYLGHDGWLTATSVFYPNITL